MRVAAPAVVFRKNFADRSDSPGVRAFEYHAKEPIPFMIARAPDETVQMDRAGSPAVRHDRRTGKACSRTAVNRRQQPAAFARDAHTGLILQAAAAMHLL